MAFTLITQGTFVQPATAVNQIIPCPTGCDYFRTTNITQGALANAGANIMGEWFAGGIYPPLDGLSWFRSGGATLDVINFVTAGAPGFTFVNSYPKPEAPITGTVISATNPAVATLPNSNPYQVGDSVVIYSVTGMTQIGGMTFTVSARDATHITLGGLNATGFTAATAFLVRRVAAQPKVAPPFYYITNITQATQGVVTVSQIHSLQVGQAVEFTIPQNNATSNGMQQLTNFNQPQNKPAIITAVTPFTFTINVDTSGYSPFLFLANPAGFPSVVWATVAPAGQQATFNPITGVQTGYNFLQVPFHSGLFVPYMLVSAGAGSPAGVAGDRVMWQCYKAETGTINAPVPT